MEGLGRPHHGLFERLHEPPEFCELCGGEWGGGCFCEGSHIQARVLVKKHGQRHQPPNVKREEGEEGEDRAGVNYRMKRGSEANPMVCNILLCVRVCLCCVFCVCLCALCALCVYVCVI